MSFDSKFLDKLLSGSASYFEKFIKAVQAKAFRIAYNILRDQEMSHEALQEGMIKFYNAIKEKKLDKNKNVEVYFYSCIRNVSIDIYRKNKLYLEKSFTSLEGNTDEQNFDVGQGADVLENYEKLLTLKNLWQLLEKIPTKLREVLLMIEYEGMSPEEVAAITSSNINTVRWRLFRAKELLRDILKSQYVIKRI